MAAAAEQLKDKKKNRLRGRFLLSQTGSLDGVAATSSSGARALEGDDQSRTSLNTSGSPSSCSRMRRMLFRRARSETEDRMRNNTRFNKVDSITDSPTPGSVHSRLNVVPQTSVLEGATATAPTSALSRLQSLMPRSPPPPYDTNSESESVRSGSVCPPTYDEAMAQNGPNDLNDSDLSNIVPALPAGYCNCRECQARYFSTEEEEQEDNCSDAVFPMETHVLMQEVLADGMAFCSLM